MAATHEIYGKRLTRVEETELFGSARGKGIHLVDGVVQWIYVTVGARQRYPNSVSRDVVRYCYSPVDRANAAMKAAYEQGRAFRVRVAPDAATSTYYWGTAKVVGLRELVEHDHAIYERYVLERVRDEDAEDDAADAAAPREKRARTDGAPTRAVQTSVDGVQYDSLLERRHAAVFDALGVEWTRSAPTFHDLAITGGRVVSYTPDFVLYAAADGGAPAYVEIKPRYPYDDEILKCTGACAQTRATFYLLYNTRFVVPFASRAEGDGQGDYAHHEGVRGLRFSWDAHARHVRVAHDVAYVAEGLAVRETPDDARFRDARVIAALGAAEAVAA